MEGEPIKYDYCMVLPADKEEGQELGQLTKKGNKIIQKLTRAGFIIRTYYSIQKDEVLVLINCNMRKLVAFADLIDYKMLLEKTKLEELAAQGYHTDKISIPGFTIPDDKTYTPRNPYECIYGKVCF